MTDPATVSTDELLGWLTAGATLAENDRHTAAIGLLDFAGLLDRASVRAHIEVESLTDDDGTRETGAWVNWAALAAATDLGPLSSTEHRLLRLAVSIARAGIGVELHEALTGLGHAHARAVLAAVATALGIADDVEITDTPAYLDRTRAHHDSLAALLGEHAAERE